MSEALGEEAPVSQDPSDRTAYAGLVRYSELARRQKWETSALPWNKVPPIPEVKGSDERRARWQGVWRSVITQQLQADMLAVEMAAQLVELAPDPEAKEYYLTMAQDEARHVEAWLRLAKEAGGTSQRDPYLDEFAHLQLALESLPAKVLLMQVFFERMIIPRFRQIAKASRGTVLEDLCNRLTVDDGIHHGAGMVYERVLLQDLDEAPKKKLIKETNRMLPLYVEHRLWRPPERQWMGDTMRARDVESVKEEVDDGIRLAVSLGLPGDEVVRPF